MSNDLESTAPLPERRPGRGRQRKITEWKAPADAPWEVPGKTHADRVIAFIERHVILPTGKGMGKPVRLRPWQKRLIRRLYGPDDRPNRAAMLSISRGNGKSALAAMLAVAELFLVPAAEVVLTAVTERQAGIIHGRAARSIELSPTLSPHAIIYTSRNDPYVLLPGRGSVMRPLPADERSLQGWSPTFCVTDEIGFVPESTWTSMTTAGGKHARSLALGIGTPGFDKGVMFAWRTLALDKDPPPYFSYVEFSADPGCGVRDKRQWKRANPALGDFLAPDAVAMDVATLGDSKFRTLRLGLWADRADQWISSDEWDALARTEQPMPAGSRVVLGFDGSVAIDSTGLVALDLATRCLHVLALWERPRGDRTWRVPRAQVRAAIDGAFQEHRVVRGYFDPYYFRDMLEDLAESYGEDRVVVFPTGVRQRMTVATDRFETAVRERTISWDGSEALQRHVLAATAEVTPAGVVVRKRADKPQPIDLAIASILAVEAAASVEPEPPPMDIW